MALMGGKWERKGRDGMAWHGMGAELTDRTVLFVRFCWWVGLEVEAEAESRFHEMIMQRSAGGDLWLCSWCWVFWVREAD